MLSRELSQQVFQIRTEEDVAKWLELAASEPGGLRWTNLGGLPNPVHVVEVATDPAAAIVERVTNSIDAVLDREATRRGATAPSPHAAASAWFDVPAAGVSALAAGDRRRLQELANNISVTNFESGHAARPTIIVQDLGTGQAPDRFPDTLLSIMSDNKKSKTHQMGVYNAGGAATYAFCPYTLIVSRRDPSLEDCDDQIGIAVIRYNPLDPERHKTGTYEYCTGRDGRILRLDLPSGSLPDPDPGLPAMPYGTWICHVAYELTAYQRAAHEPKQSLHHLFHAALPDPALPFWIHERRTDRFKGVRGRGENRTVAGLLYRLKSGLTSEHQDERVISLGEEYGELLLRYFLLADGEDPDAYTTASQGLSFVLNGQRQGTKDRYWIKRSTDLHFIWRHLVVVIDCNNLTNAAKREVFASTRESNRESPLASRILDITKQELRDDDDLVEINEKRRQQTLAKATKSTSERVKRQLSKQIMAMVEGPRTGSRSGGVDRPPRRGGGKPRPKDDTGMLETPDTLKILTDPVRLSPGGITSMRMHINAKNGWLPEYASALNVVFPADIPGVRVRSAGRLSGGEVRLTIEADPETPVGSGPLRVVLVEPRLSLFLEETARLEVVEPPEPDPDAPGGGPDVDIEWIGRESWPNQEPFPWNEETLGVCELTHDEHRRITRAEWILNADFGPYKNTIDAKDLSEEQLRNFREKYEFPVCWALFTRRQAELSAADEQGTPASEELMRAEGARVGRAVLLALEPELAAAVTESAET